MNDIKLDQLIVDAEQLLSKLDKVTSPEIAALRERVESSIADTKKAVVEEMQISSERIRQLTGAVVEYVQENPWVAVAAGTAIAATLFYIAFSNRKESEG